LVAYGILPVHIHVLRKSFWISTNLGNSKEENPKKRKKKKEYKKQKGIHDYEVLEY